MCIRDSSYTVHISFITVDIYCAFRTFFTASSHSFTVLTHFFNTLVVTVLTCFFHGPKNPTHYWTIKYFTDGSLDILFGPTQTEENYVKTCNMSAVVRNGTCLGVKEIEVCAMSAVYYIFSLTYQQASLKMKYIIRVRWVDTFTTLEFLGCRGCPYAIHRFEKNLCVENMISLRRIFRLFSSVVLKLISIWISRILEMISWELHQKNYTRLLL